MTDGINDFDHPPRGHVGALGYDSDTPKWRAIKVEDDGTIETHGPYRATTPVIYNKTMTTANTEYSQAMPSNCKKFTIKCRGEYDIKLAFTAEASGTTYITIPSGQNYWEDLIRDAVCTLYFQCATAAQVAEIVAWS